MCCCDHVCAYKQVRACVCVQMCVKIGGNMVAKMIKQNRKNSNGGGVRKKEILGDASVLVC